MFTARGLRLAQPGKYYAARIVPHAARGYHLTNVTRWPISFYGKRAGPGPGVTVLINRTEFGGVFIG